jgi:hypothetical protein
MFEIMHESDYIQMGFCPFCELNYTGRIGRGKMQAIVNHIMTSHEESGPSFQHNLEKIYRRYALNHG